MNVHVSYRLHKIPAVEKDIQHQIEKLQKRLQVFRPELIHLKGVVEEISAREGTSVSLNLRLPSGQMAVQTSAPNAAAAVKSAFEDLLQQVSKHKDLLRASHKWQRGKRGKSARPGAVVREVPFEQTLAAVFPPTISSDDIRSYVNVNLARLERFVEREIYFREAQESIAPDSLSKEEVIDETIAAALGNGQEKPERLALEPWLYRLALQSLDELSRTDESNGNALPLEDSARPPQRQGQRRIGTAVSPARRIHHRCDRHRRRPRGHARADHGLRRTPAPDRVLVCAISARARARPSFCTRSRASVSMKLWRSPGSRPTGCSPSFLPHATTYAKRRDWPSSFKAGSLQPAPLKSNLNFWGGHS